MTEREVLAAVIDLDRYPIDDLGSNSGVHLLQRIHEQLDELGAASLDGFLRPDAVSIAVLEAEAVEALAVRNEFQHDVDFSGLADVTLAASDARRIKLRTAKSGTAFDHIQSSALVRLVYESTIVTSFIGAALAIEPLHRLADPLAALNVMFYGPGDELGWHVDSSEFAVTLMLRPAVRGGLFHFVPMLRTDTDRNDADMTALLRDETALLSRVRTLAAGPGSLALFRGHWSPHRVTPVEHDRARINAVMSYSRRSNHVLTPEGQVLFYGRVATV